MGGRSYPRYKKFTVYYYLKTTGITKCILFVLYVWGCCGHDCMVVQLPVQSVPITTKVVSWNPVHGEVVLNTTLSDKICQLLATDW